MSNQLFFKEPINGLHPFFMFINAEAFVLTVFVLHQGLIG